MAKEEAEAIKTIRDNMGALKASNYILVKRDWFNELKTVAKENDVVQSKIILIFLKRAEDILGEFNDN